MTGEEYSQPQQPPRAPVPAPCTCQCGPATTGGYAEITPWNQPRPNMPPGPGAGGAGDRAPGRHGRGPGWVTWVILGLLVFLVLRGK